MLDFMFGIFYVIPITDCVHNAYQYIALQNNNSLAKRLPWFHFSCIIIYVGFP